jgi:hypothetical protein
MRYWNVLPFFKNSTPEKEQIVILLNALSPKNQDIETRAKVEKQITEWRDNPFNPHLIARMRITAFQKAVVMKYIDNLIAWGDMLFRRETIESINEATQLYIMAYNILGARPEKIPPRGKIEVKTYKQLQPDLDSFSNALVTLENEFPFSSETAPPPSPGSPDANGGLGTGITFYFCIPPNDKLLGYWDTVADRLFKIRHCMNIEGVTRQLPLFEPPIDPGLLVKATAMGLDLNSVLNDISSPLPHYRFSHLVQKAMEFCAELKALGSSLLSALEKKDAEEIALTRAEHETSMLKTIRDVKQRQVEEAHATWEALNKSRELTQTRLNFYEQRIISDVPFGLNSYERKHLEQLGLANDKNQEAIGYELTAKGASLIPNATTGESGYSSPVVTAQFGGSNLATAAQAFADHLRGQAADHTYLGTLASIQGSNQRRFEEWIFQRDLAQKERDQIDKQIATALIRHDIALTELANHDKQTENSATVEGLLRNKYTNQELYRWMESQISAVFFQSYQLAYDMAKRAEKAYRFERGLTDSNFIQFGYWDSLKKGLLSGERLYLDLKRLEMAYLDQNKREYEITKHVSLVLHDPLALIALKETGLCEIELPEALFDADYPGQYMRRLKSVSLTIPCVVGPYTSINCTLTLLSNKTRISPQGVYAELEDDSRFVTNWAAMQSIATSHAQNDSGMFELNFRDERYLPFEGAGAVSRWRIELPKDCNAFDFDTLSDVVLHVRYTAREGGDLLKRAAKTALQVAIAEGENAPLARFFSAKHEFPTDWYRFLHPSEPAPDKEYIYSLSLDLVQERFPYQFRGKTITINEVTLFLKLKDGFAYEDELAFHFNKDVKMISFTTAGSPVEDLPCAKPSINHTIIPTGWTLEVREGELLQQSNPADNSWWQTVKANDTIRARLNPAAIEDIYILCNYSVKNK